MDIRLPSKWIKEYVKTNLEAEDLAKVLSLGGPSIERWNYNSDLDDFVFDIEVTSNRADMASVLGIAREASSILKTEYLYKEPKISSKIDKNFPLEIDVENFELCLRYKSIVLTNIKVEDSPLWMKNRLEACGINSINNVVDVTNYVLLEYGQPMHAYDYDKVQGNKLVIRNAKKGEKARILGNQIVELTEKDLVIADTGGVLCIAGIKGGENAEINSNTKTIILEAANFEQYTIRKTSRRLNIKTESSSLFEKGLSIELPSSALLRAVELLIELAGAKIASRVLDIKAAESKPTIIDFNFQSVEKVLGVKLSKNEIIDILSKLGFNLIEDQDILKVTVPFYRNEDVKYDYDLIEEVARIYGYHKIPSILPATAIPVVNTTPIIVNEDRVKDILVDLGFTETFSYSMISDRYLEIAGINPNNTIKISNPLTNDFKYLRTELVSSIIDISSKNETFEDRLRLFELTKTYLPQDDHSLPKEQNNLVILINGNSYQDLFYSIKGVWELILNRFSINTRDFTYSTENTMEPYSSSRSAIIKYGNTKIGEIGLISKRVHTITGLKKDNAVIEINFDYLNEIIQNSTKTYKKIPKYPPVNIDLSFIVDTKIQWRDIEDTVISIAGEYYASSSLFDVFENAKFGNNKKNISFHLSLVSKQRTLTSTEVNNMVENIKTELLGRFRAEERK